MYEGDSFEITFDFPFDVNDYTFTSEIRLNYGAPTVLATFTAESIDTDKVKLTLTPTQTNLLPERSFWDIQATLDADPSYQQTYLRGAVFCTRQVTD